MTKYWEEIESVGKANAYWISPKGKALAIADESRHIHEIIADPETFGLTAAAIEAEYAKTGEVMGSEGDAREAIIKGLVNRGWIRIRHYGGHGSKWSINGGVFDSGELSKDAKYDIGVWARAILKQPGIDKYEDVVIDTPAWVRTYSLSQIADGILSGKVKDMKYSMGDDIVPSVFLKYMAEARKR